MTRAEQSTSDSTSEGATHLDLGFVVLVVVRLHHNQVLSITGEQRDLPRGVPEDRKGPDGWCEWWARDAR